MLDGKRYFSGFPDDDPEGKKALLHSPRLLETLRALLAEPAETRLARLAGKLSGFGYFPSTSP